MFEKFAEEIALDSIASTELFVNKVLTEVKHIESAQLKINLIPDQENCSVEIKAGADGV